MGEKDQATLSPDAAACSGPHSARVGRWEGEKGLPVEVGVGRAGAVGAEVGEHCRCEMGMALGQNMCGGYVIGPVGASLLAGA